MFVSNCSAVVISGVPYPRIRRHPSVPRSSYEYCACLAESGITGYSKIIIPVSALLLAGELSLSPCTPSSAGSAPPPPRSAPQDTASLCPPSVLLGIMMLSTPLRGPFNTPVKVSLQAYGNNGFFLAIHTGKKYSITWIHSKAASSSTCPQQRPISSIPTS